MKNEPCNPAAALERISGFHQYVLDAPAHLHYASRNLCRLLGASETELLSQTEDGYLAFVHPDDRADYEAFLHGFLRGRQSASLPYRLISRDGRIVHVLDAMTAYESHGCTMADSVLTDITRQYQEQEQRESSRYLKALSEVYDKIFEFNTDTHTVKCLYGKHSPSFKWLENIPMPMEAATENWITGTAAPEDQQRLRRFFQTFSSAPAGEHPPQIVYRALSSSGSYKTYTGIFLKLDEAVSLYCCRCSEDTQETDALRRENDSLKNLQALTMQFTEGVVAFEVEDDRVRPLYTSENVCSFFGYARSEWEALALRRPSIQEFIARSGIDSADIRELFSRGEAEFPYFDMTRNAYRRIRAICSRKYDGSGKCYVMLYNLDGQKPEPAEPVVRIRTFGYFDVFVGEQPIAFRNEKSKELFALLVDRRGGFVSPGEAISFLWEEESANSLTRARYRKVALRLKNLLEEYGIAEIVESVSGKRRLIPERVKCDLYDYLSGKEEYAQLFKGSYLTNYSWGESTLAELTGEYLYTQDG